MARILAFTLFVCLLTACQPMTQIYSNSGHEISKGGRKDLRSSQQVRLYRVMPERIPSDVLLNREYVADLTLPERELFQQILLNQRNYIDSLGKSTLFIPEYVFEVVGRSHSSWIWLSPSSMQIKLESYRGVQLLDCTSAFQAVVRLAENRSSD